MKITADMLTVKPRKEPDAEYLQKRTEAVMRHFVSLGMKKTTLSDAVIPAIARRELDFLGTQQPDFDPALRGALMMGNVGTGKTVLLQYAALVLRVGYFDITGLSTIYATGGDENFWSVMRDTMLTGHDLILDDLGAEADTKRFGNQMPIVELIYERYSLWKLTGARLWMATNLTGAEIRTRYGDRVLDRLKEMCYVVPATGTSLRKN